ncbi:MAG: hypothetical protein U0074_02750 [Kouleothrix sp.]
MPKRSIVLVAIGGGDSDRRDGTGNERNADIRIIGVEPVGSAAMRYALERGQVAPLPEVRMTLIPGTARSGRTHTQLHSTLCR